MAAETHGESLHIDVQSAGEVRTVQGQLLGRQLQEWRELTAAELGLPTRTLVVGTGHQAELWHPGILAKFVWAHEQATRADAQFVHLLVDTDTRDPLAFRAPVLVDDNTGTQSQRSLRDVPHSFGTPRSLETAACSYPARAPTPFLPRGGEFALTCVAEGVARTHTALARHARATDGAAQEWAALQELCSTALANGPHGGEWLHRAHWVRSRQLMRTTLGAALIEKAMHDPESCVRAFNRGARAVPRAARPLAALGDSGVEMPFWVLDPAGIRRRVGARALPALIGSGATLLPRAFLTSAIARAALCDRFVHGTGGALYERATEAFIGEWLGAELPGFDMATATVLLPFNSKQTQPLVTHSIRRHAWFDPDGAFAEPSHTQSLSHVPSARKQVLLAAVNAAPRRSNERRLAWRTMHAELTRARELRSKEISELTRREEIDRAHARESLIRADRTWPVPLHPAESLTRMAELLHQAQ